MMIPFSKSNFTNTTYRNVINVLKSGWLTHGKFTKLFERQMNFISEEKVLHAKSSGKIEQF